MEFGITRTITVSEVGAMKIGTRTRNDVSIASVNCKESIPFKLKLVARPEYRARGWINLVKADLRLSTYSQAMFDTFVYCASKSFDQPILQDLFTILAVISVTNQYVYAMLVFQTNGGGDEF